jgi:hypothetical protein
MRVTDRGAVRQSQCGHEASRIDSAVGIGVLLSLGEIDRHQGHRHSLFRYENANAARIRDAAV